VGAPNRTFACHLVAGPHAVSQCSSRLSPWFAPACLGHRHGIQFELVRRALCIIAPRSIPNEFLRKAITMFNEERVAVWSLAQAAGERKL
jgi:hypothetical protein